MKRVICATTCMMFLFLSGCYKNSKMNMDNTKQTSITLTADKEAKKSSSATQEADNADTSKSNKTQYDDALIDADYIMALATADDFEHAYMHRNIEDGMKYVSEDLTKSRGEEELRLSISGISNPHHVSFEILGAKKVNADTFRFNIWDYEYYSGDPSAFQVSERFKNSYIDVTRYKAGSSETKWLVSGFGFEQ